MSVLHPPTEETEAARRRITTFGPDFPFAFDDWLRHPAGLGRLPAYRLGAEVGHRGRRPGRHRRSLRADEARAAAGALRIAAHRRPAALRTVRGRQRHHRRAGRHAVSEILRVFLPLPRPGWPAHGAVPQPARPCHAEHAARPGRRPGVRGRRRQPAAGAARDLRSLARRAGRAGRFRRHPIRHPQPRRARAEGAVEPPGAAVGTSAPSTTSWRGRRRSKNIRSATGRSSARWVSAPAAGTATSQTPCWKSCVWR